MTNVSRLRAVFVVVTFFAAAGILYQFLRWYVPATSPVGPLLWIAACLGTAACLVLVCRWGRRPRG
jgi:hypothetical protein